MSLQFSTGLLLSLVRVRIRRAQNLPLKDFELASAEVQPSGSAVLLLLPQLLSKEHILYHIL